VTALIRIARIRFYSWKLQRLIAKNRARAEQYAKKRKAALRHVPRSWA
jgi:hypothetical protein